MNPTDARIDRSLPNIADLLLVMHRRYPHAEHG